jgi:phosphate transport system substrate-binding protein
MKNAAGNYITPTIDSVTAALASATIPDDFRFSMVNAPATTAYPIAGTTWLLVYPSRRTTPRARSWCSSSSGPTRTARNWPGLDYAPLPDALVKRALERVQHQILTDRAPWMGERA